MFSIFQTSLSYLKQQGSALNRCSLPLQAQAQAQANQLHALDFDLTVKYNENGFESPIKKTF